MADFTLHTEHSKLPTKVVSSLDESPNDWGHFGVKDLATDPEDQYRSESFKVSKLLVIN